MRRTIDRNAELAERKRVGHRPAPPEEPAGTPVENLALLAFAQSKSGTVHAVQVLEMDADGQPSRVRDSTLCGADVSKMTTAPDATEPTCANCARKIAADGDGDS